MLRWLARIALSLVVVAGGDATAQSTNDVASLNKQISELHRDGKYGEAIVLAERALALTRAQKGQDHPDVATALNRLAELYRLRGRYAEAEPLYKRSLGIREKALGADHASVGTSLNNLALLYVAQGRTAEAEPLYKRSLALVEKALGRDHPNVATALNNLAQLYQGQARYAEAEALTQRSLALREKVLGSDHPDVAASLNTLAGIYASQGSYGEAEQIYKRSVALVEKALGPGHPSVGQTLMNLAMLYGSQGRTAEAEPLYKRSLELFEKALGPDHASVGQTLSSLAEQYRIQGRYAEAEPLSKRSVALMEKALGPDHASFATALNNLALLQRSQGRYDEAEPLYKRSLAVREKSLGPGHPSVGVSLNNLAELYRIQGRYAEAEPLYRRSLAVIEASFGPAHPDVGQSLNNLALLHVDQGRYGEAESLFQRSLTLHVNALGPDHTKVSLLLSNIARLHFEQSHWLRAADALRQSTAITIQRAQRDATVTGASFGKGRDGVEQFGRHFAGLVKVMHRAAAERRDREPASSRETFTTAQWAHASEAASSLAQMAVRGAAGKPGLAGIVRERQDLVVEWQRRDAARTEAVSKAPDQRDAKGEAANTGRLTEIDRRIAAIDRRLAAEFPDFAALASPAPLTVEQVQADLRPDEALVLFLDTDARFKPMPEESFVWVVTKTNMRWARSALGTPALTHEVAALRCGLDVTVWTDSKCSGLTGQTYSEADRQAGRLLPFDPARAHKLYVALFGEVRDLIKDRHLLLVPSGPLAQLPFQVLVTELPQTSGEAGGDRRSIRWLARDHPLTVLPAVSSLKALRRVAKPSAAKQSMIGFGNPLLDGNQSHPQFGAYHRQQAALARAHKDCAQAVNQQTAALRGARRAPLSRQSGLADLAQLRRQTPLPETADELCSVARDLKADVGEIRLGARATEREVKALSVTGRLADYRIVHFATHGTLAGELSGTAEPGLILTPPATATEDDDGYLSAGEIAGLKLDADWVILSACNTAGGGGGTGGGGAETLSGLARAFFYAQARALLVSHWEIDSDATVKLITSAVGAISRDKSVGRAEALRRAMLAMIDNAPSHHAHPAYWAPFVVVGEGSAGR